MSLKIGVLAFHGDVSEHVDTTKKAADKLSLKIEVLLVRTKTDLQNLSALIIPGGESPTLQKLCQRENIWEDIKKIKNIFGTCAGAIMLAKLINNKTADQQTLELMDIQIDRNAYGRQTDSFEEEIYSKLGKVDAIFIRAPKIKSIGPNVSILAQKDGEVISCEQRENGSYYLACCFHPELTTTVFHEYFLAQIGDGPQISCSDNPN